jgi:MFS family permease
LIRITCNYSYQRVINGYPIKHWSGGELNKARLPEGVSNGNDAYRYTSVTPRGRWYPWYVVSILTIASTLSYLDRQILALVIEPIKHDLKLSDFQISLLLGPAFVLFYATAGLPLGYLADRWSRSYLMATGVLLWSIATAACGLARSFGQLFVGRVSVGFGEASLLPAAFSLLPDYFAPAQLPRAFGILQTASSLGAGIAFLIGGLLMVVINKWNLILPGIGVIAPWQMLLLIAATPGLLIAILILKIPEVRRLHQQSAVTTPAKRSGFAGLAKRHILFFVGLMGAAAFVGVLVNAIVSWTPSYFVRNFGWKAADIGVTFGLITLIAGASGALVAGYIAELWTRHGVASAPIRLLLWQLGAITLSATIYTLCSSPFWALVLLAGFSFCCGGTAAMLPTSLQLGIPAMYRGRVYSIYLFALALIGTAGGPVAVAVLTDFAFHNPQRLNSSIEVVVAITGPVAFAFAVSAYRQFMRLSTGPEGHQIALPV